MRAPTCVLADLTDTVNVVRAVRLADHAGGGWLTEPARLADHAVGAAARPRRSRTSRLSGREVPAERPAAAGRLTPVPAQEPERVPLAVIVREWGRIGCIGFGGPPAHIALLRKLCVTTGAG